MENKNKIKIKIKFNIIAIFSIILLSIALTPKTFQNDTFYTIKIGEHIVNNGIDMKDPFSWHEDLPYTYPHWLYDFGTYILYNNWGFTGVYAGTLILSIILGISIYFVHTKLNKKYLISFICTMLVMYLLRAYIAARAQLLTFILFIWTIYNIEKFIETGKLRNIIMLIIIPIIIANVHVAVWPFYFVLFLPYIVESIVYKITYGFITEKYIKKYSEIRIKRIEKNILKLKNIETENREVIEKNEKIIENLKKEKENLYLKINKMDNIIKKGPTEINEKYIFRKLEIQPKKYQKYLIFIILLGLTSAFITPLGAKTVATYLLKTMEGKSIDVIAEHQPTVLIANDELLVTIVLIMAGLILTKIKMPLRDYCMIAGLLFMALMSQRHVSLFMLIASLIFFRGLIYLLKIYKMDEIDIIAVKMTGWFGKICTLAIVILIAYFIYTPKKDSEYVLESKYPVHASEWIKSNLDYKNIKLYNEYNYGSYLLFKEIPVFMDSRCDLYTPEFNGEKVDKGVYLGNDILSDSVNVSSLSVDYENIFEEYGITHVIIFKNSKLNIFISKDEKYNQIYEDKYFIIYEKNEINEINETVVIDD